ncbi:ribonuclease H-like domain-containing protein [Tanacetum coccineum]
MVVKKRQEEWKERHYREQSRVKGRKGKEDELGEEIWVGEREGGEGGSTSTALSASSTYLEQVGSRSWKDGLGRLEDDSLRRREWGTLRCAGMDWWFGALYALHVASLRVEYVLQALVLCSSIARLLYLRYNVDCFQRLLCLEGMWKRKCSIVSSGGVLGGDSDVCGWLRVEIDAVAVLIVIVEVAPKAKMIKVGKRLNLSLVAACVVEVARRFGRWSDRRGKEAEVSEAVHDYEVPHLLSYYIEALLSRRSEDAFEARKRSRPSLEEEQRGELLYKERDLEAKMSTTAAEASFEEHLASIACGAMGPRLRSGNVISMFALDRRKAPKALPLREGEQIKEESTFEEKEENSEERALKVVGDEAASGRVPLQRGRIEETASVRGDGTGRRWRVVSCLRKEEASGDCKSAGYLGNKPDLATMSFDDLYNNFKIVEQEVKGTTSSNSSSSSQNMAFVSSPSSTNEVNTAYGVSTANTQVSPASTQVSNVSTQVSIANLSDDTVYAFLARQPNRSQLVYEDLEQIHKDEIEEIDLKWQLALLSMRTRRFFQKTGRKITINGSDTAGYDKSNVECFNCHKMRHFARECR